MSAYFDFIEEQKTLIQFGELEEHHIKSRKNYPELSSEKENLILLSVENHDYATLLQCFEENFALLCPWQGIRLRETRPDFIEQIDYWLSERGKEAASYTPIEACSKGGTTTAQKYESTGELSKRMSDIANCRDEYPPAAWYWRTNTETGVIERKLWETPQGEGWQKGMGPWREDRPRNSYKRRRVKCTITGHEGTANSVARWQNNRNIDNANRVYLD